MVLYKKRYSKPEADIELFSIDDIVSTSSQDTGEGGQIIFNKGNGSVEVLVENPDDIEEGIEY